VNCSVFGAEEVFLIEKLANSEVFGTLFLAVLALLSAYSQGIDCLQIYF
jgi:hypothetical protein